MAARNPKTSAPRARRGHVSTTLYPAHKGKVTVSTNSVGAILEHRQTSEGRWAWTACMLNMNALVPAAGEVTCMHHEGADIIVYRGTDLKIHELSNVDRSGYAANCLTDAASASLASGDPCTMYTDIVKCIFYANAAGKIECIQSTKDNGWVWEVVHVGSLAGAPDTAVGMPSAAYVGMTAVVAFTCAEGRVWLLQFDGKAWNHICELTQLATGDVRRAGGSPSVCASKDGTFVMYRTPNGGIAEIFQHRWSNGLWIGNCVSELARLPSDVVSGVSMLLGPHSKHLFFVRADGGVCELYQLETHKWKWRSFELSNEVPSQRAMVDAGQASRPSAVWNAKGKYVSYMGSDGRVHEFTHAGWRGWEWSCIPLPDVDEVKPQPIDPADEDDATCCVVCMDLPVQVAMVPCGHACACEVCAPSLDECPMCRETVQSRLKIFLA